MASNNSVTLQGNMTKPEVRSTASGKTITSARMVIKTYGDKDDMADPEAEENPFYFKKHKFIAK